MRFEASNKHDIEKLSRTCIQCINRVIPTIANKNGVYASICIEHCRHSAITSKQFDQLIESIRRIGEGSPTSNPTGFELLSIAVAGIRGYE